MDDAKIIVQECRAIYKPESFHLGSYVILSPRGCYEGSLSQRMKTGSFQIKHKGHQGHKGIFKGAYGGRAIFRSAHTPALPLRGRSAVAGGARGCRGRAWSFIKASLRSTCTCTICLANRASVRLLRGKRMRVSGHIGKARGLIGRQSRGVLDCFQGNIQARAGVFVINQHKTLFVLRLDPPVILCINSSLGTSAFK